MIDFKILKRNSKGVNLQLYIWPSGLSLGYRKSTMEKTWSTRYSIKSLIIILQGYQGEKNIPKQLTLFFGIMIYEIITGFATYYDIPHVKDLARQICKWITTKKFQN
ncbi:hypothetical protein Glove_487g18 [Diversispora epigaea]|uniref:Serine-threonine/tyrosine-protein kinase catalytic domain-containing protein n=1 Tax=Diversispora epigaea TaxID=1348612 RepID=A0A397GMK3_9GLOM|nr:hypothetical protein Glove_487g18 [Diversispora epigaea]